MGIHYASIYKHWMGWKTGIDYRRVFNNNHEFLWSNNELFFDFYASTYDSPILDVLNKDYRFKDIIINKLEEGNHTIHRNSRFVEALDLLAKNQSGYDGFVITRFDLWWIDSPFRKKLSLDHVNLLYKAKWGDDDSICDDNFYFIPKNMLSEFYQFIKDLPIEVHSHKYNHHYSNFHYIVDGAYYSHESPFYRIDRIRADSD